MTFKSIKLLRLLKRAQICEDNTLVIDFENMKAWAMMHEPNSQPIKKVKLDCFSGSIISTLDHLEKLEYVSYDYHSGQAHVTHSGWNATSATFKAAIQFTGKDVLVPIIVAVVTAVITTVVLG